MGTFMPHFLALKCLYRNISKVDRFNESQNEVNDDVSNFYDTQLHVYYK